MAPTKIVTLGATALPGCLALSRAAGWNQMEADWRLFLERGAVFGIGGDQPLATSAVLPYAGGGFGWIGMVLVAAMLRGQGLGTQVMRHAVLSLQSMGLRPALDATPAGALIYRPLGFQVQFGLTRWRGPGGGAAPSGPCQAGVADLTRLAALDATAFGTPRLGLLCALLHRAPTLGFVEGDGFVLGRDGDRATQIGPLVAPDEASALRLLAATLAHVRGEAIIDLSDCCTRLAKFLLTRGFVPERPFTRMALDRAAPFGDPSRLMAAAGPELG